MMKYTTTIVIIICLTMFCAEKHPEDVVLIIKGANNLGFIPNSDTIVYLMKHSDAVYDYTVYKQAVLEGDHPIPLINGDSAKTTLTFSPNAESFATAANINGKQGIWIFPTNRKTTSVCYKTEGVVLDIAWSPTSNCLAYCEKDGIAAHVWLLNLDSKKTIQLTSECSYDDAVVWMPNGKEIVYATNKGDYREIILTSINSYQPQILFQSHNTMRLDHFVSSDGKYLFFHKSIADKGSRLIMKNIENNNVYYDKYPYNVIMWSRLSSDNKKIAFNTFGKNDIILIVKEFKMTDFVEMDSTELIP